MSLLVVPVKAADIPNSMQIEHDAYARNPFTPLLFPGPFPSTAISARADEVLQQWKDDDTTQWIKVVDTSIDDFNEAEETGELGARKDEDRKGIAFAKWNIYDQPPKPKAGRQFGEGCNIEACEALFGGLEKQRQRLLEDQKAYVYLHMLHVHPSHQRRGAAGMLLKWGQEEARKRGMKIYLESSPEGHSVYLKNGFKDIECHELDMSKWGGGTHVTWTMVWDGEARQT